MRDQTGQLWRGTSTTVRSLWDSSRVVQWRRLAAKGRDDPRSGAIVLLVGMALATLLIVLVDDIVGPLPNPGLIYLPVIAMLAYHWGWRYATMAAILEIMLVYYLFTPPRGPVKSLTPMSIAQIVTLAATTAFMLGIVQLARARRTQSEREAGRFAALNHVGTALTSELDESRLLHLIAQTARELTGAQFAAFTVRPVDHLGQPLVPSEGNFFHLAAVVGVTPQQEEQFRKTPLGGEGLLAPIFRHGVPVRVPDALATLYRSEENKAPVGAGPTIQAARNAARNLAVAFARGDAPVTTLRSLGVPHGHPVIRSFLGAPLLDRSGQVRGGLLLGHSEPAQFTPEDEALLVGLAAQAAVALDNVRLYRAAQEQAQELDTIFESIADGITLVDGVGQVLRENGSARHLRKMLVQSSSDAAEPERLLREVAMRTLQTGAPDQGSQITISDGHEEARDYLVNAFPFQRIPSARSIWRDRASAADVPGSDGAGAVVVWRDVTEARRLLAERQAHAEADARRALLQTLIDELPSAVYLVRGTDARLVLANRATTDLWGAPWPPGQPMQDFLMACGTRIIRVDGQPLLPDEYATLRAVRMDAAVHQHQEIIRHQDGTTLPVLVNAVGLDPLVLDWSRTDESSTAGAPEPVALVVHQDVTALKAAERLKDEFIGIAAHELRNPLAALKGFAEMLAIQTARGKGPELADWQLEAVEAIDQAATRLAELTDDLLDVTRLQAGRMELRIEPNDIAALARRVATRAQVTAPNHVIAIHTEAEHIIVCIDVRRMEQVLTNLLNNAIKYSPEGGEVLLTIRRDQADGVAEISVQDHGIGIPAAQQARIFGRFVRADNANERGIKGTGLGLYLTRELVERHGGQVWFESEEDQGSTFFVTLPLGQHETAPAENPPHSASSTR